MTTNLHTPPCALKQLVDGAKAAALEAACRHIQDAFGHTDGGLAGLHFAVDDPFDGFTQRLLDYAATELRLSSGKVLPVFDWHIPEPLDDDALDPPNGLRALLKKRIRETQQQGA